MQFVVNVYNACSFLKSERRIQKLCCLNIHNVCQNKITGQLLCTTCTIIFAARWTCFSCIENFLCYKNISIKHIVDVLQMFEYNAATVYNKYDRT